jgi:hypothetical protein
MLATGHVTFICTKYNDDVQMSAIPLKGMLFHSLFKIISFIILAWDEGGHATN